MVEKNFDPKESEKGTKYKGKNSIIISALKCGIFCAQAGRLSFFLQPPLPTHNLVGTEIAMSNV